MQDPHGPSQAADILAGKKDDIITTVMEETASTEEWAWVNFVVAINQFRDVAAMTALLKGETSQSIIPGGQVFVQRRVSESCKYIPRTLFSAQS